MASTSASIVQPPFSILIIVTPHTTLVCVYVCKKSLSLSWNIQQNQFHIVQTVKLSSSVMIWNVRLISLFFSFIFSCTQYSHTACGKYIWAGLSHWFIVFQTVVDGCLHFNYPHRIATGSIITINVAPLGHHISVFPEENYSNLKWKWLCTILIVPWLHKGSSRRKPSVL